MANRGRILLSAAILTLSTPLVAATAQTGDPAMGTWVLNVAKSTYDPGPPPRSQTRTYAPAPNGYRFTADGVTATGEKTHVEFTAVFDGKYHPLTGSAAFDSITLKQVDASTVESVQKKGAKVVVRTTRVVSRDGKTLTTTATGTNAQGKPYTNAEVFERQ